MSIELIILGCRIAATGCAMAAGFFLTFSDFVMRSLERTSPAAGVAAMQSINREVLHSVTVVLLWSMLWLSAALGFWGLVWAEGSAAVFLSAGAAAYIGGVLVVTFGANVPMNEHLDGLEFDADETHRYWATYVPRWTRFNHLRTAGAALASVLFTLAGAALG